MSQQPEYPSTKIPPAALPLSRRDRIAWLRLARSSRVGPVTFIRLVREHGSAEAALAALPGVAALAGASGYRACASDLVEHELTAGAELGARLLCLGEKDYPPLLSMISDPPPVLWALGDVALAQRPAVAMVGARNASSLGQRMATRLAEDLSGLGFVIVSGLARGIDARAHMAALEHGTIAVQAGGVDTVYPPEHGKLAADIARGGLRLSEMPIGMMPQARHFPRRNRIISGLAQAVVVVEGAARSGSLITAKDALDQGREVMAVPGHPLDARAAGCNMLIRDGAVLVRSGADVADALATPDRLNLVPLPEPAPELAIVKADGLLAEVLNLLGPSPVSEDLLIRQLGKPTPVVLEALMELDLSGQVERHAGGLISRLVA